MLSASKDRIKRGDNSNSRWFQEKGKHTASSKPGASAYYANINSVEDYGYDHDTVELADAYQATTTQSILEVTSEKKL